MLTSQQVSTAVNYNSGAGQNVGWILSYGTVATALGFQGKTPNPNEFAVAVGKWQTTRYPKPLTEDGMLGPNTWSHMQQSVVPVGGPHFPPAWLGGKPMTDPEVVPTGPGPRWMQWAEGEMKAWQSRFAYVSESQGKKQELYSARDEMYFLAAPYYGGKVQPRGSMPRNSSRLAWCAAFVNWCLHAAGYSHTGSAGAGSFLSRERWSFEARQKPQRGCVIVVGHNGHGEHVGFLNDDKASSTSIQMLGGNQSNRIWVKTETRPMIECRDIWGNKSPFLWPLRGTPLCNLDPKSEAGHFCGRTY